MTKESIVKEYAEDFEDNLDYLDESHEGLASLMEDLMETTNHQMMMAIELTKVALSKNSDLNMSVDKVFDIYKKALQVITDASPIKKILEKA